MLLPGQTIASSGLMDRILGRSSNLPSAIVDKIITIEQSLQDLHATYREVSSQRDEARAAKIEAERIANDLTNNPTGKNPFRLTENEDRVRSQRDVIKRAEIEMVRLNKHLTELSQERNALSTLSKRIEEWKKSQGKAPVEFRGAAPKLSEGATIFDATELCQRRIRELLSDIAKAEAAPLPSTEAKRLVREQINGMADRGRPDVLYTIETGEPMKWPEIQGYTPLLQGTEIVPFNYPDALAVMAWLHRDAMIAAAEREIDELADDEHALDEPTRTKRLAELRRHLLAVEREEEHWLWLGRKSGTNSLRRPDADIRAVLGLAD